MNGNQTVAANQSKNSEIPMSGKQRFIHNFTQHRLALCSAIYLLVLVVIAIFGQHLLIHAPYEIDLSSVLQGPSLEHFLGTDHLGRSTLSRLVVATAVALKAAALGVGIALLLGAPAGLLSGYFGGRGDRLAMTFVEAIIALPGLLVAVAIIAILGPSLTNAMIALGFVSSTTFFRLMRGAALEVRTALYIDAAEVIGASKARIVFRHVLPNVTGPLTVQTTLAFSSVLLAEAGLSFIGLGVQPPESSWGFMLATSQDYIYQQPFLAVPPGLMIMMTVLAFNMLGDGLRDALARVETVKAKPKPVKTPSKVSPLPSQCPSQIKSTADDVILSVNSLEVRFQRPAADDITVVSNVSFDVPAGKTVGLIGESGCGKSVTAMAMMGLLPNIAHLSKGSVLFQGRDLAVMSQTELNTIRGADIGMIFQEPMSSLNPAFTIKSQISESLRFHNNMTHSQANKRVIELLDNVGIPGAILRANDYPYQFSGGMAQRVMIAMALACNPKLLIADEPTTALDVTMQGQILDLLSDLQEENGMSILLITHDLGVVADMCDEAIVMYAGQIVEKGKTATVLTSPQHPYTAGLLASMPQNKNHAGKLTYIPGLVPPAWDWPQGCRFHPRCSYTTDLCKQVVTLQDLNRDHQSRCARISSINLESTS